MVTEAILKKPLIFIHQQNGIKNQKKCMQLLEDIAKASKAIHIRYIVVDVTRSFEECFSNRHHLPGRNNYREFSSFEIGYQYVRDVLGIKDFNLVVSNETIYSHRIFSKRMKSGFIQTINYALQEDKPLLCGDVDVIKCKPPYFAYTSNKYISTYLFLMNSYAVKKFTSFLPDQNFEELFEYCYIGDSVFKKNANIGAAYKILLEEWLYKRGDGGRWYGFEELSKENFNKMKLKLMSIILEHNLCQKLEFEKVNILDIKTKINNDKIYKYTQAIKRIIKSKFIK